MPSNRSRVWLFTLNNPLGDDESELQSLVEEGKIQYLIIGREVGELGTSHLQGYMELPARKTLGACKRLGPLSRSHLEMRRGTQQQAIEYSKKDGDWVEWGEKMSQGISHLESEDIFLLDLLDVISKYEFIREEE